VRRIPYRDTWSPPSEVEYRILADPLDVTHLAEPRPPVTCDHRPGVLGLLAAALSGAIVGGLVVLVLTLLAAPRPARATLPSPAVDVSGGPAVSPGLTGAPRLAGVPSLRVRAGAAAGAASPDRCRAACDALGATLSRATPRDGVRHQYPVARPAAAVYGAHSAICGGRALGGPA